MPRCQPSYYSSLLSLFLQMSGARCHGANSATTSLIFKCGRVACHCKKFNWQGCQKIMLYITQPFDVSKNAIFYLVTRWVAWCTWVERAGSKPIFSFLVSGTGEVSAPWHLAPTLAQFFHFWFLVQERSWHRGTWHRHFHNLFTFFSLISWQRLQAKRVF